MTDVYLGISPSPGFFGKLFLITNKHTFIVFFVTYISLGMKKSQNFLCLAMYECRLCIQYKVSFSDINVWT